MEQAELLTSTFYWNPRNRDADKTGITKVLTESYWSDWDIKLAKLTAERLAAEDDEVSLPIPTPSSVPPHSPTSFEPRLNNDSRQQSVHLETSLASTICSIPLLGISSDVQNSQTVEDSSMTADRFDNETMDFGMDMEYSMTSPGAEQFGDAYEEDNGFDPTDQLDGGPTALTPPPTRMTETCVQIQEEKRDNIKVRNGSF